MGNSSSLALPYYGGTLLGAEGPLKWHGGVTTKGTFKSLGATPTNSRGPTTATASSSGVDRQDDHLKASGPATTPMKLRPGDRAR